MRDRVRLKSWFTILLSLLLVLGAACSDDGDGDQSPDASTSDVSTSDVEGDASQDVAEDGGDASGGVAAGERCPETCENSSPEEPATGRQCDGCESGFCYSYPEGGSVQSYCVQMCDSDEDCASLGENWFCRGVSCLNEDSW